MSGPSISVLLARRRPRALHYPGIWHEGMIPVRAGRVLDRQERVHARISVDFARELGCLLQVPFAGS